MIVLYLFVFMNYWPVRFFWCNVVCRHDIWYHAKSVVLNIFAMFDENMSNLDYIRKKINITDQMGRFVGCYGH